VVLLELFGGIAPALEAALRAGWPVKQYLYVDSDPTAIRVAQHRCATLQLQHPTLLPPSALEYAFAALPQDVYQLSDQLLAALMRRHAGQWLVVGGWECQDLSPAGSSRGLQGQRSSTFYPLMRILQALQAAAVQQQQPPPAYLVENTAFQHNWRSDQVSQQDFQQVVDHLGQPLLLDAAQFGSYAHRLRNFWTNLAPTQQLQQLCSVITRDPSLRAQHVLEPQRQAAPVTSSDKPPYYPCNIKGRPRAAFPTIMAYHNTRSTQPGQSGSITCLLTGTSSDLLAVERERAMGYQANTTAAVGVTDLQRRELLGRCIDLNTLSHIFALSTALDASMGSQHALQQLEEPRASKQPVTQVPGGLAACLCAAPLQLESAPDPEQQEQQLAEDAEMGEGKGADVWADAAVLQFLQHNALPRGASAAEVKRIKARAARYLWQQGKLLRRWRDDSFRHVPPPSERLALVRQHHEQLGHFGYKRTMSLLLHNYWWQGMSTLVKQLLAACALCDRKKATFSQQLLELRSLPIA
jgi:hypothetical protein